MSVKRFSSHMRRVLPALLSVLLFLSAFAVSAEDAPVAVAAADQITAVDKDETVFVLLDPTGAESSVTVSNRLSTPEAGVYTDVGAYDTILPLKAGVKYTKTDSAVAFDLPADSSGFTYNGTLSGAETPFVFTFAYTLDGEAIEPAQLIGKSGHVVLSITVAVNPEADSLLASRLLCQLQAPFDLANCRNITGSGCSIVIVGSTATAAVIALPGAGAAAEVEFDTDNFSADAITVSCTPFSADSIDLSSFGSFDLSSLSSTSVTLTMLGDSINKYIDSVATISDGLAQASDGCAALVESGKQLLASFDELAAALGSIPQVTSFRAALSSYVDAVASAAGGTASASGGLTSLSTQNNLLKYGVNSLVSTVTGLIDTVNSFIEPSKQPLCGFADPDVEVSSLQFVYRTSELRPTSAAVQPAKAEEKGFFERLLDLFR